MKDLIHRSRCSKTWYFNLNFADALNVEKAINSHFFTLSVKGKTKVGDFFINNCK